MFRKLISYIVGMFILAVLMSGIISFLLEYIPYIFLSIVLISPVYGAIRMQKNWSKGLASLFKGIRLRKVSLTFLLVGGIVILMLYKVIFMTLAVSLLISLGGASVIYLLWESVRFALKKWKEIEIVSFFHAIKSAW